LLELASIDMSDLLTVRHLSKHFDIKTGFLGLKKQQLHAVRDVSFSVARGEVVGLVGESGSGKSTLGRCILRLIEPSSGEVHFDGTDLSTLEHGAMRAMRRRMQIVFQDPYSSLDPRKSVRRVLSEARQVQGLDTKRNSLLAALEQVGLSAEHLERMPHEFSGGQRQRIVIARALSVGPEFIIADEPVSALDVSIQAQIINLLSDLKDELNLSILFIGHDLSVVENISDRVIVLYLGRVMEIAPVEALYKTPRHPYTRALLAAAPRIGATAADKPLLRGEQPSPSNPPSGCVFRTRCSLATAECAKSIPPLEQVGEGHFRACLMDR
jgi:oligopeptide/dipeptide ABC transporter ATP-binding protein